MMGINFRNCIDFAKRGWKLDADPDIEYRSHINGMTCSCPNSWISADAHNDKGEKATIWWYFNNPTAEDGSDWVNNWNKCADIEEREA